MIIFMKKILKQIYYKKKTLKCCTFFHSREEKLYISWTQPEVSWQLAVGAAVWGKGHHWLWSTAQLVHCSALHCTALQRSAV